MSFVVVTFYHFFDFPHFAETKPALHAELTRLVIKGSLLIASEGINATLAGTRERIDYFLNYLQENITGVFINVKESYFDRQPFARTKVRVKKEVISLGEIVDSRRETGRYVEASAWNKLIDDPEVTVIDAHNHYEVHLGSFAGTINPQTRNLKRLPGFVREHLDSSVHKKIATFCTGGIRCEKFSTWLIDQGFSEVYQLQGRILKYLEKIPSQESMWHGECFVFDGRVAVGHRLVPTRTATQCLECGDALTPQDRLSDVFCEGASCPFCPVVSKNSLILKQESL